MDCGAGRDAVMGNNTKIVVNADDFGMSHEKNVAIDSLMRSGVCTNTSLVINMPYTEEAVRMAFDGGYQDKVSLHLNLTVGESLSTKIREVSLYYADGKFAYRPIIKINKQVYPKYVRVVREELEEQIKAFLNYGFTLKGIDSHNWVHLRVPVWMALKPLIRKYKIPIVRPMWEGYKRPEIASLKWSRYFRLFQPVLLRCRQCRVLGYTSNIEQFLVDEKKAGQCEFVEVFTHPDMIDGQNIDTSGSYLGKPKDCVVNNVRLIDAYEKVSIAQILEEC